MGADGLEPPTSWSPIAAGQRWVAVGAPDDWLIIVEDARTEGAWLVRTPIGLEREIDADAIIGSYQPAHGADEAHRPLRDGSL